MATLGPIPKQDVAAATGFFSLTRQLGGSVGVALLSALLGVRIAFHRAVLLEKIVPSNPLLVDRLSALTAMFASKGASFEDARHRAWMMVDAAVNQQAAVLSFADTFWATVALVAFSIPLIFLLGRPAANAKLVAADH
jgi:DHA2 family multidrug resistance protein